MNPRNDRNNLEAWGLEPNQPLTRYELGRKAARLVAAILIAAAVVVVGCLFGYLAWLMATGVQG